jgi:hypothetical protein
MKSEFEQAWGAALKEGDASRTLVLLGGPPGPQTYIEETVPASLAERIAAKLKALAKSIETDIAYFLIHPGQSMAVNKLSFLKREILDNVESLEKACLRK